MDSNYLQIYRDQADNPDIAVGWDLKRESVITAPGYEGPIDLFYAKATKGAPAKADVTD